MGLFSPNHVDAKYKLADVFTKRKFTCDEWNNLFFRVINVMSFLFFLQHFSIKFLSESVGKQSTMSKRGQEATSSEDSQIAQIPMIPAKESSTPFHTARGVRGKISPP